MNVTWKEYYHSLGSDLIKKKNPTFLSDLSTPCCHFFCGDEETREVSCLVHVVLIRMQIMWTIVLYVDAVKLRVLSLVTKSVHEGKNKIWALLSHSFWHSPSFVFILLIDLKTSQAAKTIGLTFSSCILY